jgi:arginase family enzyme
MPRVLPVEDSASGEDRAALNLLVSHFALLPVSDADILKTGLLKQVRDPIGRRLAAPELGRITSLSTCVLGLPFDLGSRSGGANQGCAAIRAAFQSHGARLAEARQSRTRPFLHDFELRRRHDVSQAELIDLGDIVSDPMMGAEPFERKTSYVLDRILSKKAKPIVLGGDHTVTLFCLRTLARHENEFGLIHFDAHHDLYLNSYTQRSTVNHANFLAHALSLPNLKHVVTVGGRGIEHITEFALEARDKRVSWITPLQLRRGPVEKVFEYLPSDIPWYLSFDVDVLDPTIARQTGTPVLGGLGYLDSLEIMDHLLYKLRVIGADFVEVRQDGVQVQNLAADVSARLVFQVYLRATTFEEL